METSPAKPHFFPLCMPDGGWKTYIQKRSSLRKHGPFCSMQTKLGEPEIEKVVDEFLSRAYSARGLREISPQWGGSVVSEKRKGAIFCSYTGKWKEELEKRLHTSEKVTLLAIGRVRYKLLAYLRGRQDIEIVKLETRHMKNRDKGIGIKVMVRRLDKHKSPS